MHPAALSAALVFAFVLSANASLPNDLSNFVNEYVCDTNIRLVRPQSIEHVQDAVRRHTHVKAVGKGYSSNSFFCALPPEEGETSANIVMTTIRPLVIDVNEDDMSVWVSAGVEIWELMEYLGHYHTPTAPRGFALGAAPSYVNVTIGGAIATGSRLGSLVHGSLSNQVIGFRVVLANGTITEINQEEHPLYLRAFQVSVGRLGVVTDVKLRIIRENLVRRTLVLGIEEQEFWPRIRDAQEKFRANGSMPEWIEGTAFGWNPTDNTFFMYTLTEERHFNLTSDGSSGDESGPDEESQEFLDRYLEERINRPISVSRSNDGESVADGVTWEEPEPLPPNLFLADANNTASNVAETYDQLATWLGNDTLDTHQASLSWPAADEDANVILSDAYYVFFPVDRMADCLEGLIALLESQAPDTGLRGSMYFFVNGQDTGLLSVSYGKPHIMLPIDDHVYYNQEERKSNVPFKRAIGFLVTSPLCAPARLHWGHSGWPDPGCWNGAEYYPDTWCDFGCVVRDLDPEGKFTGAVPELWDWEGADLERCCTSNGYNTSLHGCECAVVRQRHTDECPPPPYYSNR